MINCENKVPFDPGIAALTDHFAEIAYYAEDTLSQIKSFHTKKAKYQFLFPQMKQCFEKNIAFYNACLMWAFYISNTFKEAPKEISNNVFYGRQIEKDEFLYDIDLLINYFDTFERNAKYYFNQKSDIDRNLKEIVLVYKKFIEINVNFTNVKTTADLKLPDEIIEYSKELGDSVFELLNKTIDEKNILKALEFKILK